jgi:hypothetical protein
MVVRGGDMRQVTGKREAGGVTTRAPHARKLEAQRLHALSEWCGSCDRRLLGACFRR